MAFQLPDGTLIRAPRRGRSFIIDGVRHPEKNITNKAFQLQYGVVEVPDPTPKQPTAEAIARREHEQRQNQRIRKLKDATIDQFNMILALFQVGRDKGIWNASDFPADLRTKVQEWRQLIDDFQADESVEVVE